MSGTARPMCSTCGSMSGSCARRSKRPPTSPNTSSPKPASATGCARPIRSSRRTDMLITDIIAPDHVAVGLAVPNKPALLELLAGQAARSLDLPTPAILAALQKREALGSTGIGQSIAVPHASLPQLRAPFGYLMVLSQPVDFAAVDDRPVDIVVLLLTPED